MTGPTAEALRDALVDDWAEYEFAGMDDPAPVLRQRLDAIIAAVRADAERLMDEALELHEKHAEHHYTLDHCRTALAPAPPRPEVVGLDVEAPCGYEFTDGNYLWTCGLPEAKHTDDLPSHPYEAPARPATADPGEGDE